ncbi:MAG TPA: hypothetical protein VL946_06630 [Lacibacter sp.]|jgi:uncharacterized protein|nr:hypothetical protein [Lacibacter sp.]
MKQMMLLVLLCVTASVFAQQKTETTKEKIQPYWFVMLLKGTNRSQDSATAAKIQEGHMANMARLHKEGKLKVAGPFGDGGNWVGLFIFDASAPGCKTKEEIELLVKTDPAVIAGRLTYDIRPWWTMGSGSFKTGIPENK